jgi:hypothetical protein
MDEGAQMLTSPGTRMIEVFRALAKKTKVHTHNAPSWWFGRRQDALVWAAGKGGDASLLAGLDETGIMKSKSLLWHRMKRD